MGILVSKSINALGWKEVKRLKKVKTVTEIYVSFVLDVCFDKNNIRILMTVGFVLEGKTLHVFIFIVSKTQYWIRL